MTEVAWRRSLIFIALVGLAAGVAVIDRYPVGVFHDDAMYVILARSLATGEGYRYLNLPGAPAATHFPPGYPAVLALIWKIVPDFPANVTAFKALNAVLLCVSAVLTAQLARERLGTTGWALGVGLLTAVSVPLLVLVTMVLSEPLFLALLLAALVLAERYVAAEHVDARRIVALGVFVGVITLVRTHGIVLLPAIACVLLARRRPREAAMFAAGTFATLLPWQLWSAAHRGVLPVPLEGNYGSYLGWWMRGAREMGPSIIPETLSRTVPEAGAMFAALFSPTPGLLAHAVTLVALLALVGVGLFSLRKRAPVSLLFFAGYAAIVVAWPFAPSRFIWGVWPLLLFVLASAGSTLGASGGPGVLRVALAGSMIWIAVGYGAYELRAARGHWWASISRAASRRIEPAVAWTLANTKSSDVIAAEDEGAMFLYTGRRAVPVASFTTAHYLSERSAAVEAAEGIVPLLAAYPLTIVLVGSTKTFDAAQYLTVGPAPLLVIRARFDGGAAFTVVPK